MNGMITPRIIEQHYASRTGDLKDCEDRVVVGKNFLAVIDGATSKKPLETGQHTPGKIVARLVETALGRMSYSATCDEAIDYISDFVKAGTTDMDDSVREKPAASIVIYSCFRREIWRVGDCLIRIGDKVHTPKSSLEPHIAAVRAAFNQIQLLSGVEVEELIKQDAGRQVVLPLLEQQHILMNNLIDSPFTFGAMNGDWVPKHFRERLLLPDEPTEIILASDGYPKVLGTLKDSEAYLKEVLENDPLCIKKHVATKGISVEHESFDDRAYLRVEV